MGAAFAAILAALINARQRQAATTTASSSVNIPAGPAPKVGTTLPNVDGWMRRKRRGRSSTILTGDLEPMDLGKRTLLG